MIRSIHTSSWRKTRKAMQSRVFLDGVDVTDSVFYADDRAGVVRGYQTDELGKIVYDFSRDDLKRVERHGKVKIVRREATV